MLVYCVVFALFVLWLSCKLPVVVLCLSCVVLLCLSDACLVLVLCFVLCFVLCLPRVYCDCGVLVLCCLVLVLCWPICLCVRLAILLCLFSACLVFVLC